jgi:hypothetical protein
MHYFFQSLKGKDDVSAEILARNLHVDYMGECTAYCTLYTWTWRMKVHEFLPEIWGKNLPKTAALVHVHTPEPAVANSKGIQAGPVHLKVPEEASFYKT